MSDIDNDFISMAEAARRLGVTAQYLYKLADQGRIPVYTRGITGRKLVKWEELQRLFKIRPLAREEGDQGEDQA